MPAQAWQTATMVLSSTQPPPASPLLRLPLIAAVLILAVAALTAWVAYTVSVATARSDLQLAAAHRLDTVVASLASELARFEYLPALLETTPEVMGLLETPSDSVLRDRANLALVRINAIAGADMLYVLEPQGTALAGADWDQPSTPVGHNYAYRPYMQGALASGRGRFFGIGVTSRKAGYFLSYALRRGPRTLGVATVKIDLEPAERLWASLPGDVVVSDERGVVLLSSRPEWKFHALRPLSTSERAQIAAEKSYTPDPPLLRWTNVESGWLDSAQVLIGNQLHLVTLRELPRQGWRVQALDSLAPLQARARYQALVAALAAAVAALLATAAWQSRRSAMDKLATQAALQAAHDHLEARVVQRTLELSGANASLAAEVQTRKAVEQDLRDTQHELVHAAKLAVLGQVSAGLAHELNQPLAALRTLSDNAVVLMDKQRLPETRANLERISLMVGRLGELTRRLKTFAHKPGTVSVPSPVRAAIINAQALLAERLRRTGVTLTTDVQPEGLAVLAEPSQFEQVLVNLLANAVDALASDSRPESPPHQIWLHARLVHDRVQLQVRDNGPGIAPAMRAQLFEPFATSKPAGSGLGLGLTISRRIVRGFGGELTAADGSTGGSCFDIDLPAAPGAVDAAVEAHNPAIRPADLPR